MNKSHYDKLFKVMLNEITVTRDAGQKEYAHSIDNVFANLERVADSSSLFFLTVSGLGLR